MRRFREALATLARSVDRRDVMAMTGVCLVWLGGERLLPGAGQVAAGAILVGIALAFR